MSDRYIDFANSSIGQRLVGALGLPSPVRLERWQVEQLLIETREVAAWLEQREQAATIEGLYGR